MDHFMIEVLYLQIKISKKFKAATYVLSRKFNLNKIFESIFPYVNKSD